MTMTIRFLGATQEVTGSCHLININNRQILLDCGLIQGGKKDELRNRDPFNFNVADIDAVILSHAHIDHSGRIPMLVNLGFRGPIYTQKATAELCEVMLRDTAMLHQRDIERQNKKRKQKNLPLFEPLFNDADVDAVLKLLVPLNYGEAQQILPELRICLSDAGHIMGSAIIELWLNDNEVNKKIVFSGDLGRAGMPILQDPTLIANADLVIMESTYGDRLHRTWDNTLTELKQIIGKTVEQSKGNILIPAFSVGRAQELLYLFNLYSEDWELQRWQIYLDSPMAIEATRVYVNNYGLCDRPYKEYSQDHDNAHPLLANVEFTKTTEESMQLNDIKQGLIIIAGSGMCNGGRIRCHLARNLWRPECDVIICGYQALGSPGRLLVDGAKTLTISGKSVEVAAKIHTVGGLSAHADKDELSHWYKHFKDSPPLILVHGEPDAQLALAQHLQADSQKVVIAGYNNQLDLTTLPKLVWLN